VNALRYLITSSRVPAAIDEIRKLGLRGHTVFASDTVGFSPGSHSKYASGREVTASPRYETRRFVDDVVRVLRERRVDVLLPAFEEVFYLAKHADELAPFAKLFFPSFETLATLHDKARTLDLARDLGVRAPRSFVVTSEADFRAALAELPEHFARPVYSRGGVELFTNTGPLAGVLSLGDCEISHDKPWVVQEFVHGKDVCTFSVVQRGRVTGHACYVHPREIEHAGGIVFESVDEPECLRVVQRIAEATRYHGQLSFDFMRTDTGMVLIECNPRPTAGVHLMPAEMLDEALADECAEKLRVAEAGVKRKYSIALVRDMLLHFREIPEDARHLFGRAKEVFADPDDLMPAVYQVVSYAHGLEHRRQTGAHGKTELMASFFHDICWNGAPIP